MQDVFKGADLNAANLPSFKTNRELLPLGYVYGPIQQR